MSRIFSTLRGKDPAGRTSQLQGAGHSYSVATVLLMYLFLFLAYLVIAAIHTRYLGSPNQGMQRYYDSGLSLCLVVCFVLWDRPGFLKASGCRPRWTDVAIGIPCGVLIKSVVLLCVSDQAKFLGPPYVPSRSFIPIIVIGSVLEEVVFRGIFLRSLHARLDRISAVIVVAFLSGLGHPDFWMAIPAQLVFSAVYLAMGDSLTASISAHVAANVLVFFPLGEIFSNWHITIWRNL